MFEARHTCEAAQAPAAVWSRWVDPARWPEWDPRVETAAAREDLAEGGEIEVKLRKGGTVRHRVTALEPQRRLITEYSLPGARVGHDRLVEPRGSISRVTHRLYVDGPLAGFWALMLGRGRMRGLAAELCDDAP